jgi:cyanate permease
MNQPTVSHSSPWNNRNLWLIALLLFLDNVHFYTWSAWGPKLLMMKGASPDLASVIASSRGWASVPAMFLVPWASYRVGLRKPFIWGPAILLVVASWSALYVTVPLSWPLMAIVGIATSGAFPMILALPLEILQTQSVGLTSGTILSIGYIGGFAGPWFAGHIVDSTGNLDLAFLLLLGTALVWALIGFLIPETGSMRRRDGG